MYYTYDLIFVSTIMKNIQSITSQIEKIGLHPTEATIYANLLQKSSLTVAELAELTGVGRTNIYPYLRSLIQANLLVELPKKRGYTLSHPTALREVIAAEQLAIQERALHLESLLPLLQQLSNSSGDTIANYSVEDGYQHLQDSLFHAPSKSVIHVRPSQPSSGTNLEIPRELQRRKISLQALTPVSPENHNLYREEARLFGTDVRYLESDALNQELFLTSTEVYIRTPTGWTATRNTAFVLSHRALVASLWNSAEPAQNALERRWKRLAR
ncbi:hypothetical protein BH11PAT4_BH11PAT4_5230 [soil metagenome]